MHSLRIIALFALYIILPLGGVRGGLLSAQEWIPINREARPYTRWWWLGSAVDSVGLDYNLREFARVGIGGVEITPIYGVQGNEKNDIDFLSVRWMRMLNYTIQRANALNIEVDMATGTGWPFGGPNVSLEDAACKAEVSADNKSVRISRTKQRVKRAAPGGEGYVIDHFDADAVRNYLANIGGAFIRYRTLPPHTFFNDSYEVYGADWTPKLLTEFAKRRGYKLEDHLPTFLLSDSLCSMVSDSIADNHHRLLSDYRETLGELLLHNFTEQWTEWAHELGAITRNQAHGSPANLIDIYAAVDIPECEGFGLSDFGIRGLRTDSGFTKKNDSDISMLKYASSAAHITGKPFTSSETFTWLTEHFRTSLSQCKPDLDLMFIAGVNHVVFHGSCYSPKNEPWPGWRFYASVDMTPYNPQWNAMPAFCDYIARCQSFLQWGEPDNDFLVYLPYYDMIYEQPGRLLMFDIHSMARKAPKFITTIQQIIKGGYDVDYISDRYLLTDAYRNYDAIIVPDVRFMPVTTINRLCTIADQGTRVIFVGHWPETVPGYGRLANEQKLFTEALAKLKEKAILAENYDKALAVAGGRIEPMRLETGLSCIRRTNPEGNHYFISNLTPNNVDQYVKIGVDFTDAAFYNPMTGAVTHPDISGDSIRLQLASGESIILRTLADDSFAETQPHHYFNSARHEQELKFKLLTKEKERDSDFYRHYTTRFTIPKSDECRYTLDLGDVRESARVVLNGKEVATLFAVPFRCDISPYLKKGKNRLDVYVTNLPANRIAQMDRYNIPWRHFKEINVVDLNYKKEHYNNWKPVPSGLCSPVKLIY